MFIIKDWAISISIIRGKSYPYLLRRAVEAHYNIPGKHKICLFTREYLPVNHLIWLLTQPSRANFRIQNLRLLRVAEGKIKPLVHFSDSQVNRNEYTPKNEKNGGSVVKSTRCSEASVQWLATVLTPAGRDLMTLLACTGHMLWRHTYRQDTHTYQIIFTKEIN